MKTSEDPLLTSILALLIVSNLILNLRKYGERGKGLKIPFNSRFNRRQIFGLVLIAASEIAFAFLAFSKDNSILLVGEKVMVILVLGVVIFSAWNGLLHQKPKEHS